MHSADHERARSVESFFDHALALCVPEALGERLRPVYVLLDAEEMDAEDADAVLSEEELIARLKVEFDAEEFDEAEDLDAEEEAAR